MIKKHLAICLSLVAISVMPALFYAPASLGKGQGSNVQVHLRDADGMPLPGAQLDVYRVSIADNKAPAMLNAKTDSKGTAELNLTTGYTLSPSSIIQ